MALDERKRDRRNPSGGSRKIPRRRTLLQGRQLFAVGVAGSLGGSSRPDALQRQHPGGRGRVEREPERSSPLRIRPQQRVRQRFRPGHRGERLLLHGHVEHLPIDDDPREHCCRGRRGAKLDRVEQQLDHHVPHQARPRVLQRSARDGGRRGGQPEPHQDQPAAVVALRHLEHPDARSLDRGGESQQADRGRLPLGASATSTARSTRRTPSRPSRASPSVPDLSS